MDPARYYEIMDARKDRKGTSADTSVDSNQPSKSGLDELEKLRGIGKDVFSQLGGGEAFIRSERENSYPRRKNK